MGTMPSFLGIGTHLLELIDNVISLVEVASGGLERPDCGVMLVWEGKSEIDPQCFGELSELWTVGQGRGEGQMRIP